MLTSSASRRATRGTGTTTAAHWTVERVMPTVLETGRRRSANTTASALGDDLLSAAADGAVGSHGRRVPTATVDSLLLLLLLRGTDSRLRGVRRDGRRDAGDVASEQRRETLGAVADVAVSG